MLNISLSTEIIGVLNTAAIMITSRCATAVEQDLLLSSSRLFYS